jgi:DNA-binding CsgD family transcriptional regulator
VLGVSPNTVKTHLARLFAKLDATTRTAAIARARALQILA